MKFETTLIFVLSLALAVFSLAQMVSSFRAAPEAGATAYISAFLYLALFLCSMFLLAFGMYAAEDDRGKVVKRVKLFDKWLSKEKK